MSKRFLMCGVFGLSFIAMACGDDEDSGGGGCAHVQMICADDESVEDINCEEFDSLPADAKSCAGAAESCDAVWACFS